MHYVKSAEDCFLNQLRKLKNNFKMAESSLEYRTSLSGIGPGFLEFPRNLLGESGPVIEDP